MGRTPQDNGEQYSEQETKRRRDAVIKRMLATPPKPHSEMKVGKPSGKSMTPKGGAAQSKKLSKNKAK
jgi:hypothetical protein